MAQQWTGCLRMWCTSHSILWLCRNSVAAVAEEELIEFQFLEGGNLISAVQSALRDGGNFPLYQWKNSAQHSIIACQGNCFQGIPWICRIQNVIFPFSQLAETSQSHCRIVQLGRQECQFKKTAHQGWLWVAISSCSRFYMLSMAATWVEISGNT